MALIERLKAIGDAIRQKNGTTDLIPLKNMPQAILDIVSGDGREYTDMIYNNDDTILFTDTEGVKHTMTCVYYDDGKLDTIIYDNETIKLFYENDVLKKIGDTHIDLGDSLPTTPDSGGSSDIIIDENGFVNIGRSIDEHGILTL
jgi:hypothetical protein